MQLKFGLFLIPVYILFSVSIIIKKFVNFSLLLTNYFNLLTLTSSCLFVTVWFKPFFTLFI